MIKFDYEMKKISVLTFILLVILCNWNCNKSMLTKEKMDTVQTIDTVATAEIEIKIDTLTKISEPFLLNGQPRYWQHFLTIYDDSSGLELIMQLKDKTTDSVLVEIEHQPKYYEEYDYQSADYFSKINKNHFRDLNFDGYVDFYIYNHGSMPMTSSTNIYVFNPKNQLFENSELLTDNSIEEVDSIRRVLTTTSFTREASYRRKHFFDQKGQLLYSEHTSEIDIEVADTFIKKVVYYEKLINGEIKKTRIDTLQSD